MGSPWTNESAILRDLSFAQGRWVPAGIDSAVAGGNGKPPTHNITEETEEEYFRHWTTDGDFSSGPDLFRIKKMLELVHDQEVPEEDFNLGPIEITKLNPTASMFVPKRRDGTKENKQPKKNKPRRARNAAIESILASKQLGITNPEPLKLAKPEDFIITKQDEISEHEYKRNDSVNKVTNWLRSQDITSMFKKKSSVNSLKENEQITESVSKVKSPELSEGVKSPNGQYTPSSFAQEYYKKAVDRSLMRDLVREDVWSRAEKIMKEIDEQKAEALRKQQEEDEAVAAAMAAAVAVVEEKKPEEAGAGDAASREQKEDKTEDSGIGYVLLSKTRHELYNSDHSTCVVCQVLTVPTGRSAPKKITPEESTPEKFTPKELAPKEFTLIEFTPKEFAPEKFTSKESAPKEFTSKEFAPEKFTPKDVTSNECAPEKFTPKEFIPTEFIPSESATEQDNNDIIKELISDSEESLDIDISGIVLSTESKESSDSSEVGTYYGLVRTSLVENLHEANL